MSIPVTRNRLIGLAIAVAIFVGDQVVKYWVNGPLGLTRVGDHLELIPFFDFTRTHNYGVSMGMLQADSPEMRWGLVIVTGLIALLVAVWTLRERLFADILPLALVLGGALGNIVDRYRWGYVLDYADFHIGTFRPFLIFNLADAAITIGVVILLARALFIRDKTDDDVPDAERQSTDYPSKETTT